MICLSARQKDRAEQCHQDRDKNPLAYGPFQLPFNLVIFPSFSAYHNFYSYSKNMHLEETLFCYLERGMQPISYSQRCQGQLYWADGLLDRPLLRGAPRSSLPFGMMRTGRTSTRGGRAVKGLFSNSCVACLLSGKNRSETYWWLPYK